MQLSQSPLDAAFVQNPSAFYERAAAMPGHLKPFYAVEAHSMLKLKPPRHTRLRNLVLRAFTTRRIATLQPEIASLSHELIDALIDTFPSGEFDLLTHFGQRLELSTALPILFERLPRLRLAEAPRCSNLYHFHGLSRLRVKAG